MLRTRTQPLNITPSLERGLSWAAEAQCMQAPERARPTARTGQRLLLLTLALLFPQLWNHADAQPTNSGSAATDRAALEALYRATDGANWKTSTNWLSGEPLSAWHGVLKTNTSGRVQVLSLHANRLHGAIPAEIANLTELELLNLNSNDLEGILPTGLMNRAFPRSLRCIGFAAWAVAGAE